MFSTNLKTVLYNVQLLETLGKIERVNGMIRSVLDKLEGIKADLVKGHLVQAFMKWRDMISRDRREYQCKECCDI